MLACKREDRRADVAATLGNDARHRHGGLVVLQGDGKRLGLAHEARSMKRPVAACRTAGGAPTHSWKSAGSSSAARSASLSIGALSLSRVAVVTRSAHSVTLARAPDSAISACTGPIGS